jgi:UDP-N-acetylglucosamine 4,6-dehydratase
MDTNRGILVTGGTGSFGSAFVKSILIRKVFSRVVIFSRDELKQQSLREQLGADKRLRFFIGDIRDKERLNRALEGIDTVVHAAALKQVDTGEYNPMEFIKTNVYGSNNLIEACLDKKVKKIIALSTDKASSPINLYGATKLTADKLFIAANNYSGNNPASFSVVRYGNVLGSRGSVIPHFQSLIRQGKPLPITDERMTRFWITLDDAVEFVHSCLDMMRGGELFVPRIPSMSITDLVEALSSGYPTQIVGIRPGEKLHEEMIGTGESYRTYRLKDRYVVLPSFTNSDLSPLQGWEKVEEEFVFRSDSNEKWLSVQDLRNLISKL